MGILMDNNHTNKLESQQYLRVPSPAKVNLFLYINGRRADGYHELQTLFQFIDFSDWLTIKPLSHSKILVNTAITNLQLEDNLIYRAARLLQREMGCQLGAEIELEKHIPMGAGLGGGSSNAASTLLALNQLWNCGLSLDQLAELGLQLGADVPIFVQGRAAFAEGVGEQLHYCQPPEKWYLVLKPAVSIATAKIFNDLNLPRDTAKRTLTELLASEFRNDCQKVVQNQYPEVEDALSWLLRYAPARLTGTGACVYAEFDDQQSAQIAFSEKPQQFLGFIAKGLNKSPLHQQLENRL